MPLFEDPYTPGQYYFECTVCGERTTADEHRSECASCGGTLTNIAVPRE
ncbi:MAG: rubrerythrin-like domain-containing protein [Halobacteriaceae archaeon]